MREVRPRGAGGDPPSCLRPASKKTTGSCFPPAGLQPPRSSRPGLACSLLPQFPQLPMGTWGDRSSFGGSGLPVSPGSRLPGAPACWGPRLRAVLGSPESSSSVMSIVASKKGVWRGQSHKRLLGWWRGRETIEEKIGLTPADWTPELLEGIWPKDQLEWMRAQ